MKRLLAALACLLCLLGARRGRCRYGSEDLVVSIWCGAGAARNLDLALVGGDGQGSLGS
ncbi:MAG: hypothetical protein WKF41_01865 [Gaiellaceae bacterium]